MYWGMNPEKITLPLSHGGSPFSLNFSLNFFPEFFP
jgi:hypothetical protein